MNTDETDFRRKEAGLCTKETGFDAEKAGFLTNKAGFRSNKAGFQENEAVSGRKCFYFPRISFERVAEGEDLKLELTEDKLREIDCPIAVR